MKTLSQDRLEDWDIFIKENIRGTKTQDALINYIKNLINKKSIIILDFEHLAKLIGIESYTLSKIIKSPESFYSNFTIPKRNGNERHISSPLPVLLNAQRWIYENLLESQPLHICSKGFRKNISIINNAKEHLSKEILLKLDLKDFFPSITKRRVIAVFINMGYTPKIAYYLASICTLNNSLPQGAPTSPMLSNIIAKRLDGRLSGLAKKFNLIYTRYADDLTFSGNHLPVKFISYTQKIINDESFIVNDNKTKILGINKQKIVTGISISSHKLTIPKKKKRKVRQEIYYIKKYGLFNHLKTRRINDPIFIERTLGYMYYWKQVEPDNKYVKKSIEELILIKNNLDKKYANLKVDFENSNNHNLIHSNIYMIICMTISILLLVIYIFVLILL